MVIEVRNIPSLRVVSVPSTNIQLSDGASCILAAAVKENAIVDLDAPQPHGVKGVALYDSRNFAGKQCIPVSQEILPERDLIAQQTAFQVTVQDACVEFTPPGRYAVAVFKGPYTGLKQATIAAENEVEKQQLKRSAGPIMEMYMNDERTTPSAELITHICIPLTPTEG